jgi:hypothetical protein
MRFSRSPRWAETIDILLCKAHVRAGDDKQEVRDASEAIQADATSFDSGCCDADPNSGRIIVLQGVPATQLYKGTIPIDELG